MDGMGLTPGQHVELRPGGKVSGTPSKSVTESRRIGERPAEPIELTFEVRLP